MALKWHVLAEAEQMSAARTKQHDQAKHTGIRTDKTKKETWQKTKKSCPRGR